MKDVMIDGKPEKLTLSWSQRLKRALAVLLVIVLVLILAAGGFVWYNLSKLSVNPFDFGTLAASSGRTNILILGIGDPGHPGENLSDTIMVLSLDHTTNQAAMISIPRDLRVKIPGYGFNKINAANVYGGPKLAEQTVADTLGIPIHYYIKTDFSGLKQAVDAVGGLDITVTEELKDPEYPCDNDQGVCGIDIKPGSYHMNGQMVLQYTRCRKGTCGNDFGRAARQQEVIRKLDDKISQSSIYLNPKTDAALLTTLRTYSQTDLSPNNLFRIGRMMKKATKTINFVYSTAPGGLLTSGAGSDLVPIGNNYQSLADKAQSIFSQP